MDALGLKEGMVFEYNGGLYIVVSAEHTHQQQRRGLVRLKAKELNTGKAIEDSFRSDVKFDVVHIEDLPLTYIYNDVQNYYFMDNSTYEQHPFSVDAIGEKRYFLKEEMEVTGLFYQSRLIEVMLPINVELKVVEAEPEHKGNTVQGGKKRIRLETGLVIQAPLFVAVDDIVRVDTRTKDYMTRV